MLMFCISFLCSFNSVSLSKLGEGDEKRQGRENKRMEEQEMREGDKERRGPHGALGAAVPVLLRIPKLFRLTGPFQIWIFILWKSS